MCIRDSVLTVVNTNDAPTVTSALSAASTNEDASYSLDVSSMCTDVDSGDTLAYTMSGAPSTLSISSGTISGTPLNADVGTHTITVTCTDGSSQSASDDYVLTVVNTNDAPTVTSALSAASTNEDASYSLDVSSMCTDVDSGDTLAYTMSGAPSTLSISSGTISGTPLNADVGTHTITVTCTDDGATPGAAASDSYVLTVANTNDATTGTVTITGDAYDGGVLTADTSGIADDDGVGTFTYQWADEDGDISGATTGTYTCLLYTSPSPRDRTRSRMPSSA